MHEENVRDGMYVQIPENPPTGELGEVSWNVVADDELPYRCTMGHVQAAATTPGGALTGCLSLAGCVPPGCRNRDYAAIYIFWHYGPPYPAFWTEIIKALKANEVPK